MNTVLKLVLSTSFSGSLLILPLFVGKRFWKDRLSRQWQYYIWLIVILRLLLPFGPEVNLLGKSYQAIDQAMTRAASLPSRNPIDIPDSTHAAMEGEKNIPDGPAETSSAARPLREIAPRLSRYAGPLWLTVALGMLLRKATIYQGFLHYIKAGQSPVADTALLDRLAIAAEKAGVKKPVELCVNPLVSSPLLTGVFHPCIVLPDADLPEENFHWIALHELTHCRRRDILYKWVVQLTVCLHWFNPLVYLMGREIARACEFSCDEAALAKMGSDYARDYGKTLLDAMAAVGKHGETFGAVTLSENKQLLKERICAIMNFKKKSMAIRLLTAALTLCIFSGAAFIGVYPVAAVSNQPSGNKDSVRTDTGAYASQAERYYQADSLPLFEIAFSRLDETAQKAWLEKLYASEDYAFFSAAVRGLAENSSLLASLTEKAYAEDEIAFFSILTDWSDEPLLESWLDRALKDGKWNFQSMLFNRLDRGDEFDKLEEQREKEWAVAQTAEYRAAGVVMDGKNYYFQGQLVNIFLDIHANRPYYTLNINPAGTVNVRIVRDAKDKITGAAAMTEAEAAELLGGNTASSPSPTLDEPSAGTKKAPPSQQDNNQGDAFDWDWDWNWDEEKDKKWDETRKTEYQAAGIAIDGKNYYFQGQLVDVFLDLRADRSICTLDRNPVGTVNIKVVRDAKNKITGVAYLTDAEVAELLADMADPDDNGTDSREITIPIEISRVKNGEYIWLGTYDLSGNDCVYYHVSAKTGQRLTVGFARPGQARPNPTYHTISNLRQNAGKLEVVSGAIAWGVEPGKYSLFVHTEGGALTGVTGYVTIAAAVK